MTRVSRSTLVWIALALAGLVVAVSVSYATSRLSKPQIGLTSEPVSGMTELAPKTTRPPNVPHHPKPQRPRPPAVTTPQPPTTPVPSGDESGDNDD